MKIIVTIDDELYTRGIELAEPAMDDADLFCKTPDNFVRVSANLWLTTIG